MDLKPFNPHFSVRVTALCDEMNKIKSGFAGFFVLLVHIPHYDEIRLHNPPCGKDEASKPE